MALQNVHRVSHTRFLRNLGVKAATKINQGEIVLTQDADGFARPGAIVAATKVVGIAVSTVDNTAGLDGALTIDVEQGVFLLDNHGVNAVVLADVAKKGTAFCEDANTVGNTNAGGQIAVGPIVGLGWENLPGVQVRIES